MKFCFNFTDVDTHEPDEKSLITYISSLYDVFPEPPAMHPLYDIESQKRTQEYCELASSLLNWMREKTSYMQDRSFSVSLIELKKLLQECHRFKNEEMPPRYRDKQHLTAMFRELQVCSLLYIIHNTNFVLVLLKIAFTLLI